MAVASHILEIIIQWATLLFEATGAGAIIYAGVRCLAMRVVKKRLPTDDMLFGFIRGLNILLGGEILRTITVRELSEVAVIAEIIAIRFVLIYIIHKDQEEANAELTLLLKEHIAEHHSEYTESDLESVSELELVDPSALARELEDIYLS